MKKSYSMILWIVALTALLTAAYTFYENNKDKGILKLPQLALTQENTATEPGSAPEQDRSPENTSEEPGTIGEGANAAENTGEASEETGKYMAPDFELNDLDGNKVKLSDFRGKIVLLNFWAVWCKYCIEEMPDLNRLNTELGEDAVILAVNVQEPYETINGYISKAGIDLKVLLDKDGSIANAYGVEGYPTTFFINEDGSLYTYIPGAADYDTFRTVLDMARKKAPLN